MNCFYICHRVNKSLNSSNHIMGPSLPEIIKITLIKNNGGGLRGVTVPKATTFEIEVDTKKGAIDLSIYNVNNTKNSIFRNLFLSPLNEKKYVNVIPGQYLIKAVCPDWAHNHKNIPTCTGTVTIRYYL